MPSLTFNNLYIYDWVTLTGPKESDSKLKKIDMTAKDYYFNEKTFEQSEVRMQRMVIDSIITKLNLNKSNIDLIIGGDLLDQISATSYSIVDNPISFLGVYSACATFVESLIVGGMFLQDKTIKNILCVTSSHNLSCEKQFRYPIEYGVPKPKTSTFTATAAISALLRKDEGKIKVESATIGKITEMGLTDANNMGAIMAPAAARTLYEHLNELKRDVDYYDLIITGDLGCVGSSIFKEYTLKKYNIKLKKYMDAGCELYLNSEEVYSGGSGPVCLPLVLFNRIILLNKYKKILIIGTGSLHSKTFVNQKLAIPAIAHAVSLEVL